MITNIAVRITQISRRFAVKIVLGFFLLSLGLAYFAAIHLGMNTDTDALLSADLPWRQQELVMERAFPQNSDQLVLVVDAPTADLALDSAARLATALRAEPNLFQNVQHLSSNEYFLRNGLLFLEPETLEETADNMVAAQPLIGVMASDPTARGVLSAVRLLLEGVERGEMDATELDNFIQPLMALTAASVTGQPAYFSWMSLFGIREIGGDLHREIITTNPTLDYGQLLPGKVARDRVRSLIQQIGLSDLPGVSVRMTGSVALDDEEFVTISESIGFSGLLSFGLVLLLVLMAFQSLLMTGIALVMLVCGLITSSAFAAFAVGDLNLISVAFFILFVGMAVDFTVQFGVRFASERSDGADKATALDNTTAALASSLILAAATTAAGFYAFLPTNYIGVSELGMIAGTSMLIAVTYNLVLLPALLALLPDRITRRPLRLYWLAGVEAWLLSHRRGVLVGAVALGVGSLVFLPGLSFDFNPLNLKDPQTESVSTLRDLLSGEQRGSYAIETLVEGRETLQSLSKRLQQLPEVNGTASIFSFIPEQQEEKNPIIADLAEILMPSLNPPMIEKEPPSVTTLRTQIKELAAEIQKLQPAEGSNLVQLGAQFSQLATAEDKAIARFSAGLSRGLPERLKSLELSLQAAPVSLSSLPPEIRRDWMTDDGRFRLSIYPAGDPRQNAVLVEFVKAVRKVIPEATGLPVSIQESARTVLESFYEAGVLATFVIAILLLLVLRRLRDVLIVFAPLILAALLSGATAVLLGLSINLANIIVLPLLFGIGVAFGIYFVMNWRAGNRTPMQSPTMRAVVFSALTTIAAFGSMAVSAHPGTADMGLLLAISLSYALIASVILVPALLGEPAPPVVKTGAK